MSTIFPGSASVGQIFDGYSFDGTAWNIIGIDLTADYQPRVANISDTEIGYLNNASANIQTQLNSKSSTSHDHSGVYQPAGSYLISSDLSPYLTSSTASSTYQTIVSGVSNTEIGYLDGVTSSIQNQIDAKLASSTASSTYLTQASASTTYASLSGATFSGEIQATKLKGATVGGDEGGEIFLGPAATNTTLAGGVTIDVWQNRLRIFEQGGNARGAFLDVSTLANGVASQIALTSNTTYVGTTAIALNRASGTQTLNGITLPSGQVIGSLTITSGAISSSGDIAITPSTSTNTLDLNSYVRMNDVYNRTSSSGANILIATNPLAYVYRSTASSGRWKNSIDYLSGELEASKLLDLPVRQFKFNNDYLNEDDKRFDTLVPGFVAEEVAQYYPIAAEIGEDGQVDDWNVRMLLPPMLKLIQDQANRIEELEQRISAIESN